MKAIFVKNLKKVFTSKASKKLIVAIDNISFEVESGEFVSILGKSGCGKTTLLRILGGLLEPTEGNVLIEDEPAKSFRLQKKFGFVFQKPSLLPWRTVIKNVLLPLEIIKKYSNNSKNTQHAENLLRLVGLIDFKDNFPLELSGGMQQRVSITRALVYDPPFLLMDEPFGALDEITRDYLDLELLRLWHNLKPTVIFVTHSIREAVFLSDRIILLSERPAKIKEVVKIDLQRPRAIEVKYSPEFNQYIKQLSNVLKN